MYKRQVIKSDYQLSVLSNKSQTPVFSGKALQFGRADIKKIELPFSFPFFGSEVDTIYVSLGGSVFISNPSESTKTLSSQAIHAFKSELSYPSPAFGVRAVVLNDTVRIQWRALKKLPVFSPVVVNLQIEKSGAIELQHSIPEKSLKYFPNDKLVQLIANKHQYINYDAKLNPQTKLRFDLQS